MFERVGRPMRSFQSSWTAVDVAALILRGVLGLIFVYHGLSKISGKDNDLGASWAGNLWIQKAKAPQDVLAMVDEMIGESDERKLEVFLNVGLGAFDGVEDLVQLAAPGAFLANAPHFALHFGMDFTAPLVEHLFQLAIAGPRHSVVGH